MRRVGVWLASVTLVGLVAPGRVLAQTDAATKSEQIMKEAEPNKDRELEIGKWYPDLTVGLTMSQFFASDNWYGGDLNSWSWVAFMYGTAENQLSPKVNWYNDLKLAYGQSAQQDKVGDGDRFWKMPEKTRDQIFLETVFRFTLGGFVDPFAAAGFSSQFLDASDNFDRRLNLNPLVFWQQAGVARKFVDKENTQFGTRLGVSIREFSRKQFVNPPPQNDAQGEAGVDGGLSWTTDLKTKLLSDKVEWTSKLVVYQTAFWSGKDDLEKSGDQLEAAGIDRNASDYVFIPDVDWENIFVNKLTKVLSVDFYVRFRYDKYDNTVLPVLDENGTLSNTGPIKDGIRKAGQVKESLGIGLSYSFF